MRRCYCKRSRLTGLPRAAVRRLLCFSVIIATSVTGCLANAVGYSPARYYFSETLLGNLESASGLWVSDAQDPLAYVYGYIPGEYQGGGYFGSGNFDLIPVLLADPLLTLSQLSQILGNTRLPAGGDVLDLTAAVQAFWANGGGQGTPALGLNPVPEPGTIWLAILGGAGLLALFGRLQMPGRGQLTIEPKQLCNR